MASRVGTLFPVSYRPMLAGMASSCAAALLLTGCAAAEADGNGNGGQSRLSLQNCGIEVAVDGPPERVYAAYQPAIEVAYALGISDRLVQTAFLDSEVLPEYTDAHAAVAYVPSLPSRDGLLATEPDFVLSGFNGVFAEDNPSSFGTRARLAELGIQSWILSPLCPSEDGLADEAIDPATVRVESIYHDLRDLGALFEVADRAEEVIAELESRVAVVEERVADAPRPTVAIISPQDDGGFRVAGGIDFGTQIIEHAGGENVFADLTELRNNNIDIEEIIKRDPDVILTSACCDATLTEADAESDVAKIVENPALAGATAVTEGNVHPFLFANRSAGVRAAHSVEQVAALIHPELFTE